MSTEDERRLDEESIQRATEKANKALDEADRERDGK